MNRPEAKPAPFRPCAVVPVYNHGAFVGRVAALLRECGLEVILVDDGSNAETKAALRELTARLPGCALFTLPVNLGKGGAVTRGLLEAAAAGFTHALQVDADGQHDLRAVPAFLDRARQRPEALIAGRPVYDASIPASRLIGRRITNFWVHLETASRDIPDAMCGFRLYPLQSAARLLRRRRLRARMEFDIEVLVRLHWRGVPMIFLPLRVTYPEGGVSHFKLLRDNLAIGRMHACLFFEMLGRLPEILLRKLKRRLCPRSVHAALV